MGTSGNIRSSILKRLQGPFLATQSVLYEEGTVTELANTTAKGLGY